MEIQPETLQVFFSYITNTQFIPHTHQHVMINQCHSCGDTVTKFLTISGDWRYKNSVLYKYSYETSQGVKSGDLGGQRINATSSCPKRPMQRCGKL